MMMFFTFKLCFAKRSPCLKRQSVGHTVVDGKYRQPANPSFSQTKCIVNINQNKLKEKANSKKKKRTKKTKKEKKKYK
ncbi:hypothetical protein DOY81_008746 [Sarcophaga bullata]|nr:hypothetical protein DOY81_008746 [Sarcophaga bullata]